MQPHGKAVPIGIQRCMDNIISKIELESDSQQLIYTSKNKFTIPWQIQTVLTKIKELGSNFENTTFKHCYREA